MKSQIIVSVCASLFGILIALLLYVFVKYLVIRAECKRYMMMIFYALAFADLLTRMVIMISLNWRPFFAEEIVIISVISMFCALLVGSSHAWILSQLNVDLRTLKCFSIEEQESIKKLNRNYKIILGAWSFIVIGFCVYFFVTKKPV